MATVYLVTSGEYSGYSVVMGFSTRELADAFCERENAVARHYGDDCRVEEYPLCDALPEPWIPRHASAILRDDGTLDAVTFWDGGRSVDEFKPIEFRETRRDGEHLRVNHYRTEAAARQALYDLAARVKAERAGV